MSRHPPSDPDARPQRELLVAKGCPGRRTRRPLRLLRPRAACLPHVHRAAADPRAGRRSGRRGRLHARRRHGRAGVFLRNGLMEYGSIFGHGGTSGRTTPPSTCTTRLSMCRGSTAGPSPTGRARARSRTSRSTGTTRTATRSSSPPPRRTRSASCAAATRPSSRTRRPSSGCVRTRSRTRTRSTT